MDASKPITFYDIASGPPVTTYAPNPWKARYALNFKGVHYKTEWVELPDVASVRQKLECPAVRRHLDGSAFYTLPIIQDPLTGKIIGDTFEIALYLDEIYPNGPRLIPASTALHRAFNAYVDKIFTDGSAVLCASGLPFNPETAERTKADFARRAGIPSWDDIILLGAVDRPKKLEAFKEALGGLAKVYVDEEEPFLEGKSVSYADMIVGGWLQMLKATLGEWKEVRTWHNGRWERVIQALDEYANVK